MVKFFKTSCLVLLLSFLKLKISWSKAFIKIPVSTRSRVSRVFRSSYCNILTNNNQNLNYSLQGSYITSRKTTISGLYELSPLAYLLKIPFLLYKLPNLNYLYLYGLLLSSPSITKRLFPRRKPRTITLSLLKLI